MRLRTDDRGFPGLLVGCLGIVLLGVAVVAFLTDVSRGNWRDDELAASGVFAVLGVGFIALGFHRRNMTEHLRIDLHEGTVTWVKNIVPQVQVRFAELGDFTVRGPEVHATGAPDLVLFRSDRPEMVQLRRDLMERLGAYSRLIELLSTEAPTHEGAFRTGPDTLSQAKALLAPADLATALKIFARGKNETLRTRARALQRELGQT